MKKNIARPGLQSVWKMPTLGHVVVAMCTSQPEIICAAVESSSSVSVFRVGQRGAPVTVIPLPSDCRITSLLALYVTASEDWAGLNFVFSFFSNFDILVSLYIFLFCQVARIRKVDLLSPRVQLMGA